MTFDNENVTEKVNESSYGENTAESTPEYFDTSIYGDLGYGKFYDEYGNTVTLQIADNSAALEVLAGHTEILKELSERQAALILALTGEPPKKVNEETIAENNFLAEIIANNEQLETTIEQLSEQNAKLAEINQYSAYIFVLVLAFVLYRIFGGALSSIFGGG